jgi:hypothetical protein
MELQNAINFNSESTMSPRTTNHKSYNWTSNTIQSHTDNMAIYRTSNLSIKMKNCCLLSTCDDSKIWRDFGSMTWLIIMRQFWKQLKMWLEAICTLNVSSGAW